MKKAIVYGAGVSGLGAKKLLEKNFYEVCLVDDIKAIKTEDIIDYLEEYSIFIKSPGIDNNAELIVKAKSLEIEIIDEVELACRYSKSKIIAITGTNGKTTVTSKINELLNYAGYKSEAAGNIGRSFAEVLVNEKDLDFIVLELSSYQLENIVKLKPFIAMITNLTPDHLNRYKSIEDYYETKLKISMNQEKEDYFLLNQDDENLISLNKKRHTKHKILTVSKYEKADVFYRGNSIFYKEEKIMEREEIALKGVHNLENSLFIIGTAKILGIENEKIRSFLKKTKNLEHRTEMFFEKGKIEFINDSKGTNVDSTLKALDEEKKNLTLICGGKDKNLNLGELADKIALRCKLVYLIGETSDKIEKLLLSRNYTNIIKSVYLEKAVKDISERVDIDVEGTVLFSPAASSFDQFKNFEERGKIFKELVRKYLEE